jgi:hypothetical protein
MQNKLLIYCARLTTRHHYIFKVLFNEVYQIEYELTDDKVYYIESSNAKLNYSKEKIASSEFFVESNGLLNDRGLNEVDLSVQLINNEPAFFSATSEGSYPFDIFSASFYLISRYEEYLPHLKDKYGRYKPEESLAFRHDFLQKPIVNIWLKQFINQLENQFPSLTIHSPKFKYISTIDIDNAYLYKGKGFVRSVASLLKAVFTFDVETIKMAFLVTSKKRKDPFDTYSLQFNLQKKYKLDVRYFVLMGDYGINDKNISHNNSNLKVLVKRLADLAPVGIHPSFGSNINVKKIAIEVKRLEDIQKREVTFSRQHFLQLSLPKTYKKLIEVGITDDFTMGYASVLGFRAGIASPFTFYNLDMEQMIPITIHPFAIIDDTLRFNMKLDASEATEKISGIIDAVKQVNGTLISIWHNDTLSDEGVWKGWRNVYEDMVKLINT